MIPFAILPCYAVDWVLRRNDLSLNEICSERSSKELFSVTFSDVMPQFRHCLELQHRGAMEFRRISAIFFLELDGDVLPIQSLLVKI
jgi:hypothetical protein